MKIFTFLFLFVLLALMPSYSFAASEMRHGIYDKNSIKAHFDKIDAQDPIEAYLDQHTVPSEILPEENWGILYIQFTSTDSRDLTCEISDLFLPAAIIVFSPRKHFQCLAASCECQEFTSNDPLDCECGHPQNAHNERIYPTTFHIYHHPHSPIYHLWISIVGSTDSYLKFFQSSETRFPEFFSSVSVIGWVTDEPNRHLRDEWKKKTHLCEIAHFLDISFKTLGVGDPDGLFTHLNSNDPDSDTKEETSDSEPKIRYLRYLEKDRFVKTAISKRSTNISEDVFVREDEFTDKRYLWEHVAVLWTNGDNDEILPSQLDQLKHLLKTHEYFNSSERLRFAIGWRRFSIRPGSDLDEALRAWGRLCLSSPVIMLRNRSADMSGMDFFDLTNIALNLEFGRSMIFLKNKLVEGPRLIQNEDRASHKNPFDVIKTNLKNAHHAHWNLIIKLKEAIKARTISETMTLIEGWNEVLVRRPEMSQEEAEKIYRAFFEVLTDLLTHTFTYHELK